MIRVNMDKVEEATANMFLYSSNIETADVLTMIYYDYYKDSVDQFLSRLTLNLITNWYDLHDWTHKIHKFTI